MKHKNTISSLLLFAVVLAGLALLLYPPVSNYINSMHQTREIAAYAEEVGGLDDETCEKFMESAREYNASLLKRDNVYSLTAEQERDYPDMLDLSGTGAFGYIEIPSVSVYLPVYHGTKESVLQSAVGHLEWTSLPIGGESTHSVLSGHRGLPSGKLLTDLDKLIEGDIFMLRVLNETLTYEVDKILIVEPQDVTALSIQEGEDLCTLVTCTPYGINTHRLLVRGHRVENREEAKYTPLVSEAAQIEPMVVAPIFAAPMLLILFLFVLFGDKKKKE